MNAICQESIRCHFNNTVSRFGEDVKSRLFNNRQIIMIHGIITHACM